MRRNHNSTFHCQLSEVHRAIDQNIIDMLRDSMVQNRILKEKIAKLEADQQRMTLLEEELAKTKNQLFRAEESLKLAEMKSQKTEAALHQLIHKREQNRRLSLSINSNRGTFNLPILNQEPPRSFHHNLPNLIKESNPQNPMFQYQQGARHPYLSSPEGRPSERSQLRSGNHQHQRHQQRRTGRRQNQGRSRQIGRATLGSSISRIRNRH